MKSGSTRWVHRKQEGRPLQGGLICCRSPFGKIGCGGSQPQKVDIALPNVALLAASYLQPSSVDNIEIRGPLVGCDSRPHHAYRGQVRGLGSFESTYVAKGL